jgi:hypothetical protein
MPMRRRRRSHRQSRELMLELGKTIDRYHRRHPRLTVRSVVRSLSAVITVLVKGTHDAGH